MFGEILSNLFGGGIEEPEVDYGDLWQQYSAGTQRLQRDYEQDVATTRANLLARGQAEGSEGFMQAMQAPEQRLQEARTRMDQSEIGQILQQNYQSQLNRARNPMFRLMSQSERRSMQDRLFGEGAAEEFERIAQMPEGQEQRIAQRQWYSREPVISMEDYFTQQFGQADISGEPMGGGGQPTVEDQSATRARRAAAGGTSPWW